MTDHNAKVIKEMKQKEMKPERLWELFAELSSVPRPSKNEVKAVQHVIEFAKKNKLEYKTDTVNNIYIYKPAQNTDSDKTVILQSHIDMVCESDPEVKIDFNNDPIQLRVDGEFLKATGTSLGSDNGIGVAAILSVLENKEISHPNIIGFITVDEESGMTGAINFKQEYAKGDYLLNLDTEDEGNAYIGSAGGEAVYSEYTLNRIDIPENTSFLKIVVGGLSGGHSGVDIHKNFCNAAKMIGYLFAEFVNLNIDFNIVDLKVGKMLNAIPRYGEILIGMDNNDRSQIKSILKERAEKLQNHYRKINEPNLEVDILDIEGITQKLIDKKTSRDIIKIMNAVQTGVYRLSTTIEGLVETSNNLGVIECDEDRLIMKCMMRSDDEFELEMAELHLISAFRIIDTAAVTLTGRSPIWKPEKENNPLLDKFSEAHENAVGIKPKITAIHAGLECAFFAQKMKDTLMISFGPEIDYPHSPSERVNIPSVERFWNILVEALKIL